MAVPDLLRPFHDTVFHDVDIQINEFFGGEAGTTVSHRMSQPLVRRGFNQADAIALVHIIIAVGLVLVGLVWIHHRSQERSQEWGTSM